MILVNAKTGLFESFEKPPSEGYLTPKEWLESLQKQNSQELVDNNDREEIEKLINQNVTRYNELNFQSIGLIRSILCGTAEDNNLTKLKEIDVEARNIVKFLEELKQRREAYQNEQR